MKFSVSQNVLKGSKNQLFVSRLRLANRLGEGEFGLVFIGHLYMKRQAEMRTVAVKTLKGMFSCHLRNTLSRIIGCGLDFRSGVIYSNTHNRRMTWKSFEEEVKTMFRSRIRLKNCGHKIKPIHII